MLAHSSAVQNQIIKHQRKRIGNLEAELKCLPLNEEIRDLKELLLQRNDQIKVLKKNNLEYRRKLTVLRNWIRPMFGMAKDNIKK